MLRSLIFCSGLVTIMTHIAISVDAAEAVNPVEAPYILTPAGAIALAAWFSMTNILNKITI